MLWISEELQRISTIHTIAADSLYHIEITIWQFVSHQCNSNRSLEKKYLATKEMNVRDYEYELSAVTEKHYVCSWWGML